MTAPISESVRAKALTAIQAGERRSAIARRLKISHASVTRIARDAKILPLPLTPGRERSLAAASRANRALNQERRSRLSRAFLEDAEKLRAQLWQPAKVYAFGGREFGYVEQKLAEPDARSKRDLVIAAAVAADKSVALDKYDRDDNSVSTMSAAIITLVDHLHAAEARDTG